MPITRQEFEQRDCSEGLGGWTVRELRGICIDLRLPVTGNKTVMCNRIKAYFDRETNRQVSDAISSRLRSATRSTENTSDDSSDDSSDDTSLPVDLRRSITDVFRYRLDDRSLNSLFEVVERRYRDLLVRREVNPDANLINNFNNPVLSSVIDLINNYGRTQPTLTERILARQRNSQVDTLTDSVQQMGLNEEDQTDFTDTLSDGLSISHEQSSPEHCMNDNIISLEPYAADDEPILIYTKNSQGKYEKAVCMTIEELTESMKADLNVFPPSNFMTIYTTPRDAHTAGYGGKPTGKLVFNLPVNNILITFGSLQMILSNKETKEFYMQPLYDGKRRRVGNLKGLFGPSMNHGQVPGFVINKLFTKNEIKMKTVVKETSGDYPMFLCDNMTPLIDLGIDVTSLFTRNLIKSLLQL